MEFSIKIGRVLVELQLNMWIEKKQKGLPPEVQGALDKVKSGDYIKSGMEIKG